MINILKKISEYARLTARSAAALLSQKTSVGLDIADHTIEVVELKKTKKGIIVSNRGRVLLKPGIVERGIIKDKKRLAEAVRKVFKEALPHPIAQQAIVFGLPEAIVYTHVFAPKLEDGSKKPTQEELDKLTLKELQTAIPLDKDDLFFSYKVLKGEKDAIEIVLVAAEKNAAREWWSFFHDLGLKIEVFDIETLALFRGLFPDPPKEPVCVIDIGAVTSCITIFDELGLRYTYSVYKAGDAFSEEIAKTEGITAEEAETKKKEIGLSNPGDRTFNSLVKILEIILKDVERVITYFEERTGKKVSAVVLSGGSSQLKSLADYFHLNLDVPVSIGSVLPVFWDSVEQQTASSENPFFYTEAIGLALRKLDNRWPERDPAIEIEVETDVEKTPDTEKEILPVISDGNEIEQSMVSNEEQRKKLRSQKIILGIIVMTGIVGVGLAFWFRSVEKAKKEEEHKSQIVQYTKVQSFDMKIPISVNAAEYTNDRVRGRIIEEIAEGGGDYREAAAFSKIRAEKQLQEGERLWLAPVNEPKDTSKVTFPLKFQWLVYVDEDANALFLKEVDKLNANSIDYMLNNIKKTEIEATDNKNVFYLKGEVSVSLNDYIQIKEKE